MAGSQREATPSPARRSYPASLGSAPGGAGRGHRRRVEAQGGSGPVPRRDHPVAAGALCLIERRVGRAEQRLELGSLARAGADPERHRQLEPARTSLLQGAAHPLGDLEAAFQLDVGQDDEELLAAEAVGELERTQALAHLIGDGTQDRVAAVMAVVVVDELEGVDVAGDEADRGAVQPRLLLELGDPRLERGPVEQPGQRVEHRRVAMLDLAADQRRAGGGDGNLQRQRHDQRHRVVGQAALIDGQRDGDRCQAGQRREYEDDVAAEPARRHRRGNHQPWQERAVGAAAQGDRGGQ
jgi:hypothetical protein